MSDDYTARMIQWIMDQASAGQPPQIPEYDVDPEDYVQDAARRENLYQDQLNDSFDFANSAAAGPGAFAPGAFDSTSTYTPVEQGGVQALRAYAARQDTPEGIIAAGILAGSTAAVEIAKLQQAYTEAEANGTLEGSPLALIPMAPPREYDGAVLPDWESLGFRMGDIEEAYITEAQGGTSGALFDPNTGEFVGGGNRQYLLDENNNPVLVDVETQMSEAAQRFADQGLSNPNEQFTAADLMDPNQAQYMPDLGGVNDAWLNAMAQWQAETAPLPPQDLGKAGQFAQPPAYDKGQHPAAPAPAPAPDAGAGGGGLNDMDSRQRVLGDVAQHTGQWLRDLITSSGGMAGPQTSVGGSDPYGFPTTSSTGGGGWEGMIESIPADVAQAGITDLNVTQNALARLFDNWGHGLAGGWQSVFGGGNDIQITPEDIAAEEGIDLSTPSAPMPPLNTNDLAAVFGTDNAGTGTGGGGAGGQGAPRTVNDLPGPDLPTYPNQPPTQPTVEQMIQILMGGQGGGQQGGWDLATSPGAYVAGMRPHPDQYAVQSGQMSADQARQPSVPEMIKILMGASHQGDWYAQQGGYSPEGPTKQPTTDQMLSIMGQQARPQPTRDQTLSIMGQRPQRENMHDVTGDQQVRIGKRSTNTRSNAPTVRDYYPKPKARDTTQSRMAQENANAAWQRTRQQQRATGIGTGAYGRAAAAAYLLAQQGITPLSTQQAARRSAGNSYR